MKLSNPFTRQLTEPTQAVGTVEELRELLRLDSDVESDLFLTGLLLSATDYAVRYLGRSLLTTEWTRQYSIAESIPGILFEYSGSEKITLPYGPVQTIERVYFTETDGTVNEITDYFHNDIAQPEEIILNDWAPGRFLSVDYFAGYGEYGDVPQLIKHGILQHAAYLYTNRGDCEIADGAKLSGATMTYSKYRVMTL